MHRNDKNNSNDNKNKKLTAQNQRKDDADAQGQFTEPHGRVVRVETRTESKPLLLLMFALTVM
jgi:hypothetical protein